ncbi:hypothetical protein [Mycolicibacterium baixiangningiae]|uniref:hypothetical protein n=1 Tax=Mycolicibacterium baixiangningiae TaxID=2761578 RepID=UPI001E2AFF92|nr:hypothetical protein [Mycolicibacterium baixiangningiae]
MQRPPEQLGLRVRVMFVSDRADPEQVTRQIMTSPEFAADMAGFDTDDIVDVQSVLLDPTSFSPIR